MTGFARRSFVELGLRDDRGVAAVVKLSALRLEEAGPIRSVICARAGVRRPDGEPLVDLTVRVQVFRHLPAVRCHVTIRNPRRARHAGGYWELGDEGSIFITEMWMAIESVGTTGADVLGSVEEHAPLRVLGTPLTVYQDSSGGENWRSAAHLNRFGQVRNRFRGYHLRGGLCDEHGLRASPTLVLRDPDGEVSATVRHFWQNCPIASEADERRITLRLPAPQYDDLHELQAGEQKTYEIGLGFEPDSIADVPLDWCRTPLLGTRRA